VRARVHEANSGRIRKVIVDSQGKEIDLVATTAMAQANVWATHGSLSQDLVAKLSTMKASDTVSVMLVYAIPTPLPQRPTKTSKTNWDAYKVAIVSTLNPLGDAIEKKILAHGGSIIYRSVYGPFVEATLSKKAIETHFAKDKTISSVSIGGEPKLTPASMNSTIEMELTCSSSDLI